MTQPHRCGRLANIAVAGATGRVGRALLAALADDRVRLTALSRTAPVGEPFAGARVARIDSDAPASLRAALDGMDRLFISHGSSDRQVADEIALIDAAVACGVEHIVKLSVMGPPTRLHPFDWHMAIEDHMSTCAVGFTILRPSTFMDTLARAGPAVARGAWGGTSGAGRVNLIDTRDVAAVARVALLDERAPGSQRALHLTGPGAVSMPEVAIELSRLLGRTVTYADRTRSSHRDALVRSGVSEMMADLLLGLETIFRESVLAETTDTVAAVTGRPPRCVVDWLKDHIDLFA